MQIHRSWAFPIIQRRQITWKINMVKSLPLHGCRMYSISIQFELEANGIKYTQLMSSSCVWEYKNNDHVFLCFGDFSLHPRIYSKAPWRFQFRISMYPAALLLLRDQHAPDRSQGIEKDSRIANLQHSAIWQGHEGYENHLTIKIQQLVNFYHGSFSSIQAEWLRGTPTLQSGPLVFAMNSLQSP